MAEPSDTHIVEIPTTTSDQSLALLQHHPLTEISMSPGHLLLLKLFQREEDQLSSRISLKETRLDNLKRDAFHLSSLFFAFHGLFLTLLFTSSLTQVNHRACKNWCLPCFLSLLTSLVVIAAVQSKVCGYWRVLRALQRDRADGRALTRCMQEMRMKGSSFDLDKEPQVAKRMKSSSVEIEWRPLRWLKENLVAICLTGVAAIVAPACKLVLCSS